MGARGYRHIDEALTVQNRIDENSGRHCCSTKEKSNQCILLQTCAYLLSSTTLRPDVSGYSHSIPVQSGALPLGVIQPARRALLVVLDCADRRMTIHRCFSAWRCKASADMRSRADRLRIVCRQHRSRSCSILARIVFLVFICVTPCLRIASIMDAGVTVSLLHYKKIRLGSLSQLGQR